MQYFLSMQGRVIGPMTPQQVFAYNPNPNVQVSIDGINWQPLYTFPELMQIYHNNNMNRTHYTEQESKKTLCGIMALLFGAFGVQYFVIGKVGAGFLTILLSLVTCGLWEIITFIQGIVILSMSEQEFRRKFIDSTSTLPLF